jgi:flagellar M-ring protein FliF
MAVDSNAIKQKALGALNGFSTGQKAVVVIAVITLVVGGVFFAQWAAKPTMVPLFSNLEPDDAGEITTSLQSSGVKYELADNGGTIMVSQADVYQTRLNLAGEGLPAGGSEGYALLDEQGLTTSEFREQVDYQRALEGELSKTIGSIEGVEAATVHLAIPEDDVFAADEKQASASVLLKTRPGQTLDSGQVQAVVNLVGSSIEGMSPDNVTVADAEGKVLAAPGQEGGAAGMTDAKDEATNAMETGLSSRIQSMLTPVVGQGKAIVQANAELNFDQIQRTEEIWNPTNREGAVTSESVSEEAYGGGNPNATGILGTDGVPLAQGAEGGGDYARNDTVRDFANDREVTQTEVAPGSVDRLSIAVLLDSNVANVDVAEVERLVTDAAGLEEARGDTVTVSRMPFDQTQADAAQAELEAAAEARQQEQLFNIIRSVATVLIILAVLAILYIVTKRRAKAFAPTPISLSELEQAMPAEALPEPGDIAQGALEAGASSVNDVEARERAKVDKEITDLIERQPDEVAGLLRSWLADRRS